MKLSELVALRNKLQPTGSGNSDVVMFDYKFWKETESIAKKQKEKALETVKSLSQHPDTPGVILRGQQMHVLLKETAPIQQFDLETFIGKLVEKFPQERMFFRTAALESKIDAYTRKTYSVEDNDD